MRAPEPMPPEIAADLAAMDAAMAGRPHPDGDPVLADLARLLRETRPEPDTVTARRLDSRTATAFRASSRGRRRPVWLMPALGACASLVLVVIVAVALHGGNNGGASTGESDGSAAGGAGVASSSDSSGTQSTTAAPKAGSGSAGASSAGSGALWTSPALPGGEAGPARAVERSATMTIGVPARRLDDAASGAARVATTLGGYVASSSVSAGEGADLDLRVPSARVDQAVARLSQLGHVRALQRATLDITDALTSAHRRVQEDRAERRSLLRQLASATTGRERDRIRARLATVTRRLDAERSRLAQLRSRAGNATISVTIMAEHRHGAGAGGHWTPGDALHDAARVLEVAAGVALVALAVLVPLGLVGIPAWIAARRLGRRRREQALDLA